MAAPARERSFAPYAAFPGPWPSVRRRDAPYTTPPSTPCMPLLAKCMRLSAKHAPPSKRCRSAAAKRGETRRDAYSSYAKLHTLPPILFYFWNFRVSFRDIFQNLRTFTDVPKNTHHTRRNYISETFLRRIFPIVRRDTARFSDTRKIQRTLRASPKNPSLNFPNLETIL